MQKHHSAEAKQEICRMDELLQKVETRIEKDGNPTEKHKNQENKATTTKQNEKFEKNKTVKILHNISRFID